MKNQRLYLENIAECIERIESYTSGGKTAFLEATIIQDAVIRNFEIIGEAARVSEDIKQAHSEVPWRQVTGFRDVLIHDYLRVNLIRVWKIVERDLPSLKSQIAEILQQLNE